MVFYLDKYQIRRLATNDDVYNRGEAYAASGRVGEIEAWSENDGGIDGSQFRRIVSVTVYGEREYTTQAYFDSRGMLVKYKCDCDAFGVWRGGCKHVVALLLTLFDANYAEATRNKRKRAARNVLELFERRVHDELATARSAVITAPNGVSVELRPKLSAFDNSVRLSLVVGRGRMYIVKKVGEFVDNIKKGAVMAYGKGLEFEHKKSCFDERSARLIDIVTNEYSHIYDARRAASLYGYYSDGRELTLSKRGVDDLMDLYENDYIDMDSGGNNFRPVIVLPRDVRPQIKTTLTTTEEGVSLKIDAGFSALHGEKNGYLITEDKLFRVARAYIDDLSDIRAAIEQAGTGELFFPAVELSRFATFMIPRLRAHGLYDGGHLAALAEYELVKEAYVDAEDGDVTCKVTFRYGGVSFNALDLNVNTDEAFTRDLAGEFAVKDALSAAGFVPDASLAYYRLSDEALIYAFYNEPSGIESLQAVCEVFVTDAFLNKSPRKATGTRFGLRIDGGILNVTIDADKYPRSELVDILRSYRLRRKYHRLKDGSFVTLDDGGDVQAAAELISGLGLTDREIERGEVSLPQYRAIYAEQVLKAHSGIEAAKNGAYKNLTRSFGEGGFDIEPAIPEHLTDVLRGYQKEGFRWLQSLRRFGFGGVLADDMGLGKTIQVISVIAAEIRDDKENKPSIVVAPTSLIYNWEKEFARFAPSIRASVVSGSADKRAELVREGFESGDTDVYITTYDALKRDIDNYEGKSFRFVIADEAQNIKNPTTQNAKSVKALSGETKYALTGTPIENALSELWSIFDFVMPGYLFNETKFGKHYETPIMKHGDQDRAMELRRQTAPFVLRRVKRDVLKELPEKIETTIYAEMTEEQRKIYAAYLMETKGQLDDVIESGQYDKKQIEILAMLTRLRQICCHPATFAEGYEGGSGKLDATTDVVTSHLENGSRLLIFSQFTRMLNILEGTLKACGVQYFYLDGQTPAAERVDMTERFNGGERGVFLISLKAGGAGLNLTGADVVIHYDPWWNPAVMEQASGRAHRFGQKKVVQVVKIVAKDSIEEKIMELQAKKKDLIDSVIQEGAQFISKMTKDELMGLFEG